MKERGMIKNVCDFLLGNVYPSFCQICEKKTAGIQAVCAECEALFLPQEGTYCLRCAEQLHKSQLLEDCCLYCQKLPFSFEFVVTAYLMSPNLRHCIHVFKYKRGTHLIPFLSKCLSRAFLDDRIQLLSRDEWVISSVPVHHIRERERGFDQSFILASEVSKEVGFPYRSLLKRITHTSHQARLNKKERAENIKRAFTLSTNDEIPKKIILVDDVFTTGATTHACTQILRRAGAERVIVVCLARR